MPIKQESINRDLYGLLKSHGYKPDLFNSSGKKVSIPEEAEAFQFEFIKDGEKYGKVTATIDGLHRLILYYGEDVSNSPKANSDSSEGISFTDLRKHLKRFAKNRGLGFELKNEDNLEADMAKRDYTNREEISEGYYPINKTKSYSDNVPSTKIIIQHNRVMQEGEQRFRSIEKIFVENVNGERFLLPTNKPGIARVYARHISEGGTPYDDRGTHITNLVEEYTKMAGFVRATKGKQFNESAEKLINEGINHYSKLRETLHKMSGKKGYKEYFDNYSPSLMENENTEDLSEIFLQSSLDPRIETVMPILSKLSKSLVENENNEVKELEEWADSIIEGSLELEEQQLDEKCWDTHKQVGMKNKGGKMVPNCVPKESVNEGHETCPECGGAMYSEDMINEKKDACYYKVKSRYKVWPSAYASGALVKCRKKGAKNWGSKSESIEETEEVDENLRKWFKEKWVRFGPDGKIRGDCARGDDSEGKPKCLPQSKAHSLGKKGRASAAARKRREDPNPERSGKAINVATKKKSNEGVAEGSLNEGVMDQLKRIYMMLVSDLPMGTPESEFLEHWQRIIRDDLGKNIDIDTLAKLRDNFVSRYKTMGRRGDVGDWHREMGMNEQEVEKSKNDLSQYSTERLQAYVKKVSGGGVTAFGSGAKLKRVQQELKRREQGVAEGDVIKGPWSGMNKPEPGERYVIIRTKPDGTRDFAAGHFDSWQKAKQELQKFLEHELHTELGHQFEIVKKKGVAEGKDDLSQYSTERLQAYVKKVSGGGVPAFGSGAKLKRVQAELKRREQGVAEGQLELNTPDPVVVIQDKQGKILDKVNLSVATQKYKLGNPQSVKQQLAHQNYTTIGNYVVVSPMGGQPQDNTTKGLVESNRIIKIDDYNQWSDEVDKLGAEKHVQKNRTLIVAQSWDGEKVGEFDTRANKGWLMTQGVAEANQNFNNGKVMEHEINIVDELNVMFEDWQKTNRRDKTSGMSRKAVKQYRRENPGSKLQTAVTTKPSKLKKGSKASKRRKSFCSRMRGMKKSRTSAKTARDPNSNINKALRRWNCESIEDMRQLIENATNFIAEKKNAIGEAVNPAQQAAIAISMKKAGKKPKSMKEGELDKQQKSAGQLGATDKVSTGPILGHPPQSQKGLRGKLVGGESLDPLIRIKGLSGLSK